ncbi:YaaA family protein [Candidatus Arthromitus sp. SFB-rat-Yit]|uniref:YaaA family protein n=1 Tax=Candidatus Arthromitus sp. SFB-rat-Yit TaxID=1041504 RepID=UPI001FA71C1A|nr:YaaA family protein [Candidatus Arthromitus sp. SFB-rat-Yit]
MKEVDDSYNNLTMPTYIEKAKEIVYKINSLSDEEIRNIMGIDGELLKINRCRYKKFKFDLNGNPAILSYTGTVYKNINANVFDNEEIEFCKDHIRILSGVYGILKPYDSIYEYRLEFKTKVKIGEFKDIYAYFGKCIYDDLVTYDNEILNLCSNEYSKAIIPYLSEKDEFVTCSFKIKKNNTIKSYAMDSKITRGKMVNFIVKNKINRYKDLREFNENGYSFNETLSNKNEYIFTK